MTRWHEPDCEIGGCLCPIWAEWIDARSDYAMRHPLAADIPALTDDDEALEAIEDLAEELDGEFAYLAPPCPRPTCQRHQEPRHDG